MFACSMSVCASASGMHITAAFLRSHGSPNLGIAPVRGTATDSVLILPDECHSDLTTRIRTPRPWDPNREIVPTRLFPIRQHRRLSLEAVESHGTYISAERIGNSESPPMPTFCSKHASFGGNRNYQSKLEMCALL